MEATLRSLRALVVVLLLVFVGALFVHSLMSLTQDLGRHLKAGEIIWKTKSVPRTNLFSFTEPDTPFINHHWLSEVAFYLLTAAVGLKGLILAKTAILLGTFGILFAALRRRVRFWALVAATLAGAVVFNRTDVRPEIFSYLFLALFLAAIFKAKYEGESRWLSVLPLVQILWTNAHISFPLGPGLLLFFLIDRVVPLMPGGAGRRPRLAAEHALLRKIALSLLLTSAATLVNPSFLRGALEPFVILHNYGMTVVENQNIELLKRLGLMRPAIWLFEISVVILLLSFLQAFRRKAGNLTFELLASAAATILSVRMVRNIGVYALILIPVLAQNLESFRLTAHWTGRRMQIGALALTAALLVWLTGEVVAGPYGEWTDRGFLFGLAIPAGAEGGTRFVLENDIQGPVFNNFAVGNYLIWKLYPRQRVFVDGRPEAYTPEFFKQVYVPMLEDPHAWRELSEKYGINYVLIDHLEFTPWLQKFVAQLGGNPDWPLVYDDPWVSVYLRETPANAAVIARYARK